MPTYRAISRFSNLRHQTACLYWSIPIGLCAVSPAVAQAPMELPGIVVQGATLQTPPPRARSAPVQSASTVSAPAVASEPVADVSPDGNGGEGVPLEQLGTSVTVVTRQQLESQQIRHAGDALRSLPGVSVNRAGTSASLTQVRIRGGDANHTLVLIDGVEANAGSDGAFDFSDLMTEDIERIEVIRGPQSALYGSNAMGGVVNVITRARKGPMRATARVEAGSFNTKEGAASISGGTERVWGTLTVQGQRSDGFNIAPDGPLGEKDGYRLNNISAKIGAMLTEDIRLDLNIRRSDKSVGRDDETGLNSRDGWIISSDSFSRYASTVLLMGADLRWDMLEGALTHQFKATGNITDRNDVMIADFGFGFGPPSPVYTTDEAYKFSYLATYRFNTGSGFNHVITGLVDRSRETIENETDAGFVEASREQTGFAAEWRGDVFNQVFLSVGVRHDDNSSFEDFTTWRTGISVPMRAWGIRPHASAGTGVKLPTMVEQFGFTPFFVPNPNLKPEESTGWDAGVEFTMLNGRAIVDVTYFSSRVKNQIDGDSTFVPCDTSPFGCTFPVNLPGTSTREGVEISGRFALMQNLSLGLSYTYLDAEDSTGNSEVRRPPHAARADLNYGFHDGRGNVHLAVVYNGEVDNQVLGAPIFFPVGRVTLDDYWLVSAAASYKINPGLEVYGRVENLFDEKYEEVYGFNSAGAAVYAGLRWTFDADRPSAGLLMK